MRWIFNDNLRGNGSLQHITGRNNTIHVALCKVRLGQCLHSCDRWLLLIQCSQATTTAAAECTLETEAADSEPVPSPSHENQAAMAELFVNLSMPRRLVTTLWPRQQKRRWCCCLACWLSETYLCLDPLPHVRNRGAFHRDCQQADFFKSSLVLTGNILWCSQSLQPMKHWHCWHTVL